MGRKKTLTKFEQGRIVEMKNAGKSIRAIHLELGRSRNAIRRYLNNQETYGVRNNGSPAVKITSTDRRNLLREARKGESSASTIKNNLNLPISTRRIQQILTSDPHLQYKKPIKRPPLLASHCTARLNWARERHAWSSQQWGRTIFSDEKKWNLDGPDGHTSYWHDLRTEDRLLSRRQKGGGGVMIWGSFSSKGCSTLAFLDGRQNSNDYCYVLENHLLPFTSQNHPEGFIFQQDNASIHKSNVTMNWLESQNIDVMPWPARSPDLNPIENLWGVLSRRVYANGRQFSSISELRAAIQAEWDRIDQNLLNSLVNSMSFRCAAVLEARGKGTKY